MIMQEWILVVDKLWGFPYETEKKEDHNPLSFSVPAVIHEMKLLPK